MRTGVVRLLPAAAAAWITAAVCTQHPAAAQALSLALWTAAAAALGFAARPSRRSVRHPAVVAAVAVAFAAGAASHVAASWPAREAATVLAGSGARDVTVSVLVTGKIEPRAGGAVEFDAVTEWMADAGGTRRELRVDVTVRADAPEVRGPSRLDVGSSVLVRGRSALADPGARSVLRIFAGEELEVSAEPSGIADAMSSLRRGLVAAAADLPGPGADLVPGLAVGDTSAVDAQLDAAMKASSLSHLTAVSGANCALVVGIVFAVLAALQAPRWVRVAGGFLALAGFTVLVTPEPSVVRAAAMAAIAMLATLLGRRRQGRALLSLAVALLLVLDPWLAGSLGFALSTAATAALLVLARPLASGIERVLPRSLALVLAVPLAAQLACGPLLVLVSPTVPLYGVVANLLAAPAAPIATVIGLAACLAAPVPVLATGLAALAWLPASWIAATAMTFADLPGGAAPWLDGVGGAVALAVVGAAVVALLVPRDAGSRFRWIMAPAAAVTAITSGIVLGAVALGSWAAPLTVPAEWAVLMCDVGQGDATLLRSGGAVALVDTGPDPAALEGCLRRAGVSRVDLLVLTHFDADHAGAAPALAGRVGTVLHGPEDAHSEAALRPLAAGGARIAEGARGEAGALAEARWEVLWPERGARAYAPGNDASLVVEFAGGGLPRVILLGDLSASPQGALVRMGAIEGAYDVVKVAHHGSADQDARIYSVIDATIGMISVGAGNPYGHPRDELLALLARLGTAVARTDESGAVAVWLEPGGLRLWRERGAVPGPG